MKYMGSKNRISKQILPIILKNRKNNQYYVEPMVGGANLIDKVDGLRIGGDSNIYLISLLKEIQNGWIPPTYISEYEYKIVKNNKNKYPKHYVGFVGFCCSYSGKWFGGFSRETFRANPDSEILNSTTRNYCDESKRNLLKQKNNIEGVYFVHSGYKELCIPEKSIIYFDPPYKGATGYKCEFNHNEFWDHVRLMSKLGHECFVSEYEAPSDFLCIWSKEVCSSLTKDTGSKKAIEKLFIYNPNSEFQDDLDF